MSDEVFNRVLGPQTAPQVMRLHLPTAEFLARAIRASATAEFRGPTWHVKSVRDGMKTAADVIDALIAEAKRGGA